HLLGEELEAALELRIRQSTEGKGSNDMFERDRLMDVAQFFEHLFRGSRSMQAAEKLDCLDLGLGVRLQLTVGLLELGIKLIAFDAPEMTIGEVIVIVDRVPHHFQMTITQLGGLTRIIGYEDVEQPNRRPRRDVVRQ